MTYLLGLAVAIVWGLIIYRIFDAVSSNDDSVSSVSTVPVKKEAYNDFSIEKDTTKLLLNYRDPFGLVNQKDTTLIAIRRSNPVIPNQNQPKPVFNWDFIRYSGFIKNPASKKIITVISINGKNELLFEGETKSQVKLIRNMGDSVKINYNGKIKFIPLKTSL